ncbi:MAG: hypothetical protein LQ341_007764 [Variospora aurantia]|nr:MAG: hypothetical protein LQ341_007764 [Variospora aurantia]
MLFPNAYDPWYTGTGWENVEYRSYRFVEGDGENASLEEMEESRQRRSKKPLTKEEKTQLRETVPQDGGEALKI